MVHRLCYTSKKIKCDPENEVSTSGPEVPVMLAMGFRHNPPVSSSGEFIAQKSGDSSVISHFQHVSHRVFSAGL